jgi:hypothetical protein
MHNGDVCVCVCVCVTSEYKEGAQKIEIYAGEYVISMTDKIIECTNLLENLMQSIQLEKFRRG